MIKQYDDDPDFRLAAYFLNKYRLRVPLYQVCGIRAAWERGETDFQVRGRCTDKNIPINIMEVSENIRAALV
jgi:hypothetical protein